MDDANRKLQNQITQLREAIMSTKEVCERSQREHINKMELFQALNALETNTARVAKGIKEYIKKSQEETNQESNEPGPINQEIVNDGNELQIEAQDKIVALNTVLQYQSQNPDAD